MLTHSFTARTYSEWELICASMRVPIALSEQQNNKNTHCINRSSLNKNIIYHKSHPKHTAWQLDTFPLCHRCRSAIESPSLCSLADRISPRIARVFWSEMPASRSFGVVAISFLRSSGNTFQFNNQLQYLVWHILYMYLHWSTVHRWARVEWIRIPLIWSCAWCCLKPPANNHRYWTGCLLERRAHTRKNITSTSLGLDRNIFKSGPIQMRTISP